MPKSMFNLSSGDSITSLNQYINPVGSAIFIACALAGGAITARLDSPWPLVIGLLTGVYFLFGIKVANQWEKAAVLRFGKYTGLRGPGLFFIVPIVDSVSQFVDQRVRVTDVTAESTLTRDTVPVNVNAIVFWVVWPRDPDERTDCPARIDRPSRTGANDHESRIARPRIAEDSR